MKCAFFHLFALHCLIRYMWLWLAAQFKFHLNHSVCYAGHMHPNQDSLCVLIHATCNMSYCSQVTSHVLFCFIVCLDKLTHMHTYTCTQLSPNVDSSLSQCVAAYESEYMLFLFSHCSICHIVVVVVVIIKQCQSFR